MSRQHARVLAATLLAAVALVGGCSNDAEAPAADPIEGSWLTAGKVLLTFAGGQYEAVYPEGYGWDDVTGVPFEVGTYEVAGTTLTLAPAPQDRVDPTGCPASEVAVYEMTVSDDGSKIRLEMVEDDCASRRGDFNGRELTKAESK